MTNIPKAAPEKPIVLTPKISIHICTHRFMNPFFVNSLLYMIDYMNKTGMRFEINSKVGVSNIAASREQHIQEALNSSCTHMFMVDDDMVFAMDIVHKMLSELNKLTVSGVKKSAMGVNACRKSPSGLFYTAKGVDRTLCNNDGFLKSKGLSGVTEVERCGLGAFLIETSILRDIEAPHFEVRWLDDKKEHAGEDFYFIKKLRDHGVSVFVDNDISNQIGHAGEFVFNYGTYREASE